MGLASLGISRCCCASTEPPVGVCPIPINEIQWSDPFDTLDPGWVYYGSAANPWSVAGGRLLKSNVVSGAQPLLRQCNFDPTLWNYVEQSSEFFYGPALTRAFLFCLGQDNNINGWQVRAAFQSGSGPDNMGVFFSHLSTGVVYLSEMLSGDKIGSRAWVTGYSLSGTSANYDYYVEVLRNDIVIGNFHVSTGSLQNICTQYHGYSSDSSVEIEADNYNFLVANVSEALGITYPNYTSPGEQTDINYDWTLNTAEDGEGPILPTVTGGTPPYTFAVISGQVPDFFDNAIPSIDPSDGGFRETTGGLTALPQNGSFTVRCTDNVGATADTTINWVIQ